MKKTKRNKLWNGKISLRDYEVDDAIKAGGICIEYNGDTMFLYPSDLKKGIYNKQKFNSKWGNKEYVLVDYDWKPTKQLKINIA